MAHAGSVLGRVSVRSDAAVDPVLARLRLAQMLAGSSLRPSGLPPSAVLCVRRLADPRPGTLRLDSGGERPPPEWERAFVAALERVMRGGRPSGPRAGPGGAEAVLFADRAELLACLARDICDGTRADVNGGGAAARHRPAVRAITAVQRGWRRPEYVTGGDRTACGLGAGRPVCPDRRPGAASTSSRAGRCRASPRPT